MVRHIDKQLALRTELVADGNDALGSKVVWDDVQSVRLAFSRNASVYGRHAGMQEQVAHKTFTLLAQLKGSAGFSICDAAVLEIGCGTGILTEFMLNGGSRVTALDLSSQMIEEARSRLGQSERLDFKVGDFLNCQTLAARYPLVVSSSSLHWILPLEKCFGRISQLQVAGDRLVFSIMLSGTLKELHEARNALNLRKRVESGMPSFSDVCLVLERSGYKTDVLEIRDFAENYSDGMQMLKSLSSLGVCGGVYAHRRLSRGETLNLVAELDRRAGLNGVSARYHVGFFSCVRL